MTRLIDNSEFSDEQIEKIVETILADHECDGGATVNAAGENLSGKKFYAVAVFQHRSRNVQRRSLTEKIVRRFVENNLDLLAVKGCVIGSWYDYDGNVSILDVSLLLMNKSLAIKLGKDFNQIAIYDLHRKKEINLGGSGSLLEDKRNLSDKEIIQIVIEAQRRT